MNIHTPQCGKCTYYYCQNTQKNIDKAKLPAFCPMKTMEEALKIALEKFNVNEFQKRLYYHATIIEDEAYEMIRGIRQAVRPRIREIVEFCKKVGFKKIGVVFCSGVRNEAKIVVEVFENFGLEVYSAICKCGSFPKPLMGVPEEELRLLKQTIACNSVGQAELMNQARTDINVICGLCIGHDIIFTLNSKAPVTTLIVKDRVTGHSSINSLYVMYLKRVVQQAKSL